MEFLVSSWFESPVEKLTYLVRDGTVVTQKFAKKQGMPHLCRKRVAVVNVNRKKFIEKAKLERKQRSSTESLRSSSGSAVHWEEEDDADAEEEVVVMACMWSRANMGGR